MDTHTGQRRVMFFGWLKALLARIGLANQAYTLRVSTNLSTWTDWTNVIPASLTTPLTDPDAARHTQRFCRARTR